ncbi:sarcoglycan [Brevundimonas sp. BT-123]|uniref:sarcoglycan n=1 Tax=Brevundimonas sp. BT-123 TaxID=2986928 RepID=UPI0022368D8A|nr:sarcoglycan [Brevundimonas sp. BT-123]MCW0044984.1 sarcoglycan [Brevundimonas sp. BT-123]
MSKKLARARRLLERIRHARHPLRGWRRWAVIAGQGLVGFVALFAFVNLALSLSTFRGEDPLARTVHELRVLWFSPPDGQPMSPTAFPTVYGRDLGPAPDTAAIHAYLEREAEDGVFLLDHVMVDRILKLNGRIDARSVPSGVYVGAHALGPDGMPLVPVTKFMAQYLLFPRHAYILVVPESGPAIAFSASQNAKFGIDIHPERLSAEIAPFDPNAYDFPSSGEALHEMTRITNDPVRVATAVETLTGAQARLAQEGLTYGLLAPNSNTAVGCVLQGAGAITQQARSSILLALRAPGFGASCE